MATGGRVVHHLQYLLPDARDSVILTGYQAVGTWGHQLAEGAKSRRCSAATSAFGPRWWSTRDSPCMRTPQSCSPGFSSFRQLTPETIYIVHGEPESSRSLADKDGAATGWCVVVPEYDEKVRVDGTRLKGTERGWGARCTVPVLVAHGPPVSLISIPKCAEGPAGD
jgi:metallo-beta-lactamase family protein